MKEIKDLNMKSKEALKSFSSEKLITEIKQSEKILYTMRMKLAVGELKQTHLMKILRRYIASIKTLVQSSR